MLARRGESWSSQVVLYQESMCCSLLTAPESCVVAELCRFLACDALLHDETLFVVLLLRALHWKGRAVVYYSVHGSLVVFERSAGRTLHLCRIIV